MDGPPDEGQRSLVVAIPGEGALEVGAVDVQVAHGVTRGLPDPALMDDARGVAEPPLDAAAAQVVGDDPSHDQTQDVPGSVQGAFRAVQGTRSGRAATMPSSFRAANTCSICGSAGPSRDGSVICRYSGRQCLSKPTGSAG